MNATLPMLLFIAASASVAAPSTNATSAESLLEIAESTGRREDYAAAEAALAARHSAGDRSPATIRALASAYGRTGRIEDRRADCQGTYIYRADWAGARTAHSRVR